MYLSSIYILDTKGKPLISRNYRGDVDATVIDHFMQLLLEQENDSNLVPIIQYGSHTFIFTKHTNLYLVAISKLNTNVTLVLQFLYRIIETFTQYFNVLEEESIRDNFVIMYELLDEFMDFGYPQITDPKVLQEYITQEGQKQTISQVQLPADVTGAVSIRPSNIKYSMNEVFMDVVESVNVLISSTGNVMRSEILGSIKLKVHLSGIPELRLGLNDKFIVDNSKTKALELEDVKFHQCVRLSRFEKDKTISFIPPDGDFELMSYRLNAQIKPLFWVEPSIERYSHSRVEYFIKAKSNFKRKSTATNVQFIIPVPSDVDGPKFKTSVGTCKYIPETSCFVWKIKSFPGLKDHFMRAHFNLPSVEMEEKEGRPPIQVKFEIPYFTTSGIQVRYLKIIEKSGYPALPWVRYLTQNGDYFIRTQ